MVDDEGGEVRQVLRLANVAPAAQQSAGKDEEREEKKAEQKNEEQKAAADDASQDGEGFAEGDRVVVVTPFRPMPSGGGPGWAPAEESRLRKGERGTPATRPRIDEDGDACVVFDRHEAKKWVRHDDFSKLALVGEAPPSGTGKKGLSRATTAAPGRAIRSSRRSESGSVGVGGRKMGHDDAIADTEEAEELLEAADGNVELAAEMHMARSQSSAGAPDPSDPRLDDLDGTRKSDRYTTLGMSDRYTTQGTRRDSKGSRDSRGSSKHSAEGPDGDEESDEPDKGLDRFGDEIVEELSELGLGESDAQRLFDTCHDLDAEPSEQA
eukprot:gene42608-65540_t